MVCNSLLTLFIGNSEIDDLHLVSVRPAQRLGIKSGYLSEIYLCDQQNIKNPANTLLGSLVPRCSLYTWRFLIWEGVFVEPQPSPREAKEGNT